MSSQQDNIINCPECGQAMDISLLPPYANAVCPNCGAMTRVKTRMGPYRITGKLGKGGMSVVFRAEDSVLGREVALKVLNETYAGDAVRSERFEREAQIMARVSHENLVQIYAVGHDQGLFYIAMELVEGNGLDSLITAEERVPEDKVLSIALDIVRGLDAAWNAGLMHRDIKARQCSPGSGRRSQDRGFRPVPVAQRVRHGTGNMGNSLLCCSGNPVARGGRFPHGHVRSGGYHVPYAGRRPAPGGCLPVVGHPVGKQEKPSPAGPGGERHFPADLFHRGQIDGL